MFRKIWDFFFPPSAEEIKQREFDKQHAANLRSVVLKAHETGEPWVGGYDTKGNFTMQKASELLEGTPKSQAKEEKARKRRSKKKSSK